MGVFPPVGSQGHADYFKLGIKIVWEITHLMVVLTRLGLAVWRHKQRLNLEPKFKILFLTLKSV